MKHFKTEKGTELPMKDLKGKDYLEVKFRLVWFREEHPSWGIETQVLLSNATEALVKATIKDESGRIVAVAHKTETQQDFPAGHTEKAETGAIGRALALCGYGTQFAPELDEGERIVDSPIERVKPLQTGHLKPVVRNPVQAARDHVSNSGGVYRVPFGKKFRGKALSEMRTDEIENYMGYLETDAAKTGKMSPEASEFIAHATAYLGAASAPVSHPASSTPAIGLRNMPTDGDSPPAWAEEDIPF